MFHATLVIFWEFFAWGLMTTPTLNALNSTFPTGTFLFNGVVQGIKVRRCMNPLVSGKKSYWVMARVKGSSDEFHYTVLTAWISVGITARVDFILQNGAPWLPFIGGRSHLFTAVIGANIGDSRISQSDFSLYLYLH